MTQHLFQACGGRGDVYGQLSLCLGWSRASLLLVPGVCNASRSGLPGVFDLVRTAPQVSHAAVEGTQLGRRFVLRNSGGFQGPKACLPFRFGDLLSASLTCYEHLLSNFASQRWFLFKLQIKVPWRAIVRWTEDALWSAAAFFSLLFHQKICIIVDCIRSESMKEQGKQVLSVRVRSLIGQKAHVLDSWLQSWPSRGVGLPPAKFRILLNRMGVLCFKVVGWLSTAVLCTHKVARSATPVWGSKGSLWCINALYR